MSSSSLLRGCGRGRAAVLKYLAVSDIPCLCDELIARTKMPRTIAMIADYLCLWVRLPIHCCCCLRLPWSLLCSGWVRWVRNSVATVPTSSSLDSRIRSRRLCGDGLCVWACVLCASCGLSWFRRRRYARLLGIVVLRPSRMFGGIGGIARPIGEVREARAQLVRFEERSWVGDW